MELDEDEVGLEISNVKEKRKKKEKKREKKRKKRGEKGRNKRHEKTYRHRIYEEN